MPPTASHRRVEIVITLLVIAGLAAYSIPRFIKARRVATEAACHENIARIEKDIDVYQLAYDMAMPPSLDALYGKGGVGGAAPVCPLNGTYRLVNGSVSCGHGQ